MTGSTLGSMASCLPPSLPPTLQVQSNVFQTTDIEISGHSLNINQAITHGVGDVTWKGGRGGRESER